MTRQILSDTMFRVALPCYENRVMPRFGCSRAFVFADILKNENTLSKCTEHTWIPETDPDLPTWLRLRNVTGVLCGGIHPRFQIALEAQGLWVSWGFRGEILDILKQWLTHTSATQISGTTQNALTCCRLQQPIAYTSTPDTLCKRGKPR